MAGSPRDSEQQRRLIREFSQNLGRSSPAMPLPSVVERNSLDRSYHSFTSGSLDFDQNDEVLASTRHLDDQSLPQLRATAKRYGYYNPPQIEPRIETSVVNKHFKDFDDNHLSNESDSSVEIVRGPKKDSRAAPDRRSMSPSILYNMEHDSLYDVTPPARSHSFTKKQTAETGSLRRDVQLRNATAASKSDAQRRRSSLAEMHAKVSSEEDSFTEERPPTVTNTFKNTRFGNSRSRQTARNTNTALAHLSDQQLNARTPQKQNNGTPKPAQNQGNVTQQSFMLPDLPNLTELVSGVFKDGTPVFSKTAKHKTRFSSAPNPSRFSRGQPNFVRLEGVPIPDDEKAIFASLQLLKEKVAELEQEKAESEKQIEEQQSEIIGLKAELAAQKETRRSDSALGSTDGEGNGQKTTWKVEKSKLEISLDTLRGRLDRAERKASIAEIATKRITSERDNLVTQLGVAFYNSEELKAEKETLQKDNVSLRHEIDAVRAENGILREELESARAQYVEAAAQFQEETQQLRRADTTKDAAVVKKENEALRAEVARLHSEHEEQTQRFAQREMKLKERSSRKEQAEYSKLKAQNDALKAQLVGASSAREEQGRKWAQAEAELRAKLDIRDQTIQRFEEMSQLEINESIKHDNENLRVELARANAQRQEETSQWTRKEARLRNKIQKRNEAVENLQEFTKEILGSKTKIPEEPDLDRTQAKQDLLGSVQSQGKRRTSEDTKQRIAQIVEEEVENSRADFMSGARLASNTHNKRSTAKELSRYNRSVSAPTGRQEDVSDGDSTTDLSPRMEKIKEVRKHSGQGAPTITQSTAMDLTYLSFMSKDELAKIRKTLEEERAAARRTASMPTAPHRKENDTVRSMLSNKLTQHKIVPRKSSMKDVQANIETSTNDFANDAGRAGPGTIDTTWQLQTQRSGLSQGSRKRRSAPIEMTSAFIIPDITVRNAPDTDLDRHTQEVLNRVEPHDSKDCLVCMRSSNPNADVEELSIPAPIPVSSRGPFDPDATARPAQSPPNALALVLKELKDELAHLHIELAHQQSLLRTHDPSLGMRKRKAMQRRIQELLRAVDIKSNQIYTLYDVLEGQKLDGLLNPAANGEAVAFSKEVEDTLRSVGLDPKEAQKGKKVLISEHEMPSRGEATGQHDESSGEEELPWEGFSETESLPGFRRSSGGRRRSVGY